MDDVTVKYNSDKPTQLNALAYAQGTNIHIAIWQEKHLPHKAWHVVQQKQGRVKPTLQMINLQQKPFLYRRFLSFLSQGGIMAYVIFRRFW